MVSDVELVCLLLRGVSSFARFNWTVTIVTIITNSSIDLLLSYFNSLYILNISSLSDFCFGFSIFILSIYLSITYLI
jgi:hypothetical protein